MIGRDKYKEEYLTEKIDQWNAEIRVLSDIAKIEPQAAYSCFISGYKHKITYCMRTMPNIEHLLQPIDFTILTEFIPAITNGTIINETERKLFALPTKYGGMGIPTFSETSKIEYENSLQITEHLTNNIINQNINYEGDPEITKKKNNIKTQKSKRYEDILEHLPTQMNPMQQRLNKLNTESGSSIWLASLPLKEEGYVINKQNFWDLVKIRYGWELTRLPENCECGAKFNIKHALSCKKGGFISLRHNEIRNITACLLKGVCRDVCVEPRLQLLTGESLGEASANRTDEARLDISARGFLGHRSNGIF